MSGSCWVSQIRGAELLCGIETPYLQQRGERREQDALPELLRALVLEGARRHREGGAVPPKRSAPTRWALNPALPTAGP